MCNNYSPLELFASGFLVQFGSHRDKCSVEVSIGWDRGQEPSNRECPDHIGAVGTYEPGHSQNVTDTCTHKTLPG